MSKEFGAPIGAWCKFKNYGETAYVSFGQYKEDVDEDEFGVMDDIIFYYAFEGESQLVIGEPLCDDFILESYRLVF